MCENFRSFCGFIFSFIMIVQECILKRFDKYIIFGVRLVNLNTLLAHSPSYFIEEKCPTEYHKYILISNINKVLDAVV